MKTRKNISNKLSEKDVFIKITNDILEDILTVEEALELYPVIPESNYKEKLEFIGGNYGRVNKKMCRIDRARERYCRCIKNIRKRIQEWKAKRNLSSM